MTPLRTGDPVILASEFDYAGMIYSHAAVLPHLAEILKATHARTRLRRTGAAECPGRPRVDRTDSPGSETSRPQRMRGSATIGWKKSSENQNTERTPASRDRWISHWHGHLRHLHAAVGMPTIDLNDPRFATSQGCCENPLRVRGLLRSVRRQSGVP